MVDKSHVINDCHIKKETKFNKVYIININNIKQSFLDAILYSAHNLKYREINWEFFINS